MEGEERKKKILWGAITDRHRSTSHGTNNDRSDEQAEWKRWSLSAHPLHPLQTPPPRLFQYTKAADRRSTPRGRLNLTWKQETVLGFVSRPGRSQGTVLERPGVQRVKVATPITAKPTLVRPRRGREGNDDDDDDQDTVDNRDERRPRNARERHD